MLDVSINNLRQEQALRLIAGLKSQIGQLLVGKLLWAELR